MTKKEILLTALKALYLAGTAAAFPAPDYRGLIFEAIVALEKESLRGRK
jgi:hypothetical protein